MTVINVASRVQVVDLSIQSEGQNFVVGRSDLGTFIRVPAEAVDVLRLMDGSRSLQDIHDMMEQATGVDVDVLDFASSLVSLHFVNAIDGHIVSPNLCQELGSEQIRGQTLGRVLFSRTALSLYALLSIAAGVLVLTHSELLPSYKDAFATPSIGGNLLIFFFTSWMLTCVHELGHVLAAAHLGVKVRLRLNLRLFWLVAETDMTGLWSVPKSSRYVPYLAGMAWDSVIFCACLVVQLVAQTNWLRYPRLVGLIIGYRMLWQLLVFLRTDLYYVLTAMFDSANLGHQARAALHTVLPGHPRSPEQWEELSTRERVSAWAFLCMSIVGYTVGVFLFFGFQLPGTALAVTLAIQSVLSRPSSGLFWDGVLSMVVMTVQSTLWLIGATTAIMNRRGSNVGPAEHG